MNATLNDGTYIWNQDSMTEYLLSLGFDKFDIQEYIESKFEKELDELENYKEAYKAYERRADAYFCNLRDMALEVTNLCNKYANKKGGVTKAKMAQEIKKVVNFYRVD